MLIPQINCSFTVGCTNLKLPALQDHQMSGHKQAVKYRKGENTRILVVSIAPTEYNNIYLMIHYSFRGV